jgi:osmoprotectant transport system permease protein
MLATTPLQLLAAGQPWIQWSWVSRHTTQILLAVREHIYLTAIAVGLGLVIALPLGIVAYRWRQTQAPILGLTGTLYTIPSLALLGFLIPITGLGTLTAEIALVGYTLLILVRNVIAGLEAVPPDVREAARGMGFTPRGQLVKVELPLALPAIMAGIRIATVTTIGLVTITALIGAGGLGQLINAGLIEDFRTKTVVGAGLSVILAVVADGILVGVGWLLAPWARHRRPL